MGSFGDGPGRYKQLLTDTGLLKGRHHPMQYVAILKAIEMIIFR